jgi:hypothetical protein
VKPWKAGAPVIKDSFEGTAGEVSLDLFRDLSTSLDFDGASPGAGVAKD